MFVLCQLIYGQKSLYLGIYEYTYEYLHVTTMKKDMNSKESKEGNIGGFGVGKKGEK